MVLDDRAQHWGQKHTRTHTHTHTLAVPSWAVRPAQLEHDEIARVIRLFRAHGDESLLVREVRAVQRLRRCLSVRPHDGSQRALRGSLAGLFPSGRVFGLSVSV